MGEILIHKLSNEALAEKRKQQFFALSNAQRFHETLKLIRISMLFSKNKNLENRNNVIIRG
jgi:hypothetical protein